MTKKKNLSTPSESGYRYIFSAALVCIVFVAIFAVRLHIAQLDGDSQALFSNTDGIRADWFLYCKELIYTVCDAGVVLWFIGEKIFGGIHAGSDPILKKQARLPLILIGIYAAMTVISAIFAEHRQVVLMGGCTEYEGVLAVLSYCLLFCGGYNYFSGEKALAFFKRALFVLIAVTAVLSVIEYLTVPLLEMPFMKYIAAPAEYRSIAESVKSRDSFRQALLMFNNPNYMGGFCTIIFPLSVYFIVSAKSLRGRIICAAVCAGTVCAAVMSGSTAALYVVIGEIIFLIIFMITKKMVSLKALAITAGAAVVMVGILSIATGNAFVSNIIRDLTNASPNEEPTSPFYLDEITMDGYTLTLVSGDSRYTVTPPVEVGEKLEISAENGTQCTQERLSNNGVKVTDTAAGAGFSAIVTKGVLHLDLGCQTTADFAVTTAGLRLIAQNGTLLDEIPSSPFNGTSLARFYGFATGRGYIWLNTLPILRDCIIIGKGSGNFPFYFTQNDIAGLARSQGTFRVIADKPHNRYLHIAVDSGIPAMAAVLVLFGIFAVGCIRLIFRTAPEGFGNSDRRLLLLFMFTGICGFMIMGLTNDSSVTVDPFFWFIFGIAHNLYSSELGVRSSE